MPTVAIIRRSRPRAAVWRCWRTCSTRSFIFAILVRIRRRSVSSWLSPRPRVPIPPAGVGGGVRPLQGPPLDGCRERCCGGGLPRRTRVPPPPPVEPSGPASLPADASGDLVREPLVRLPKADHFLGQRLEPAFHVGELGADRTADRRVHVRGSRRPAGRRCPPGPGLPGRRRVAQDLVDFHAEPNRLL